MLIVFAILKLHSPLSKKDEKDLIAKITECFKDSFILTKKNIEVSIIQDEITIKSNVKLEYSSGPIEIQLINNDDENNTMYIDVNYTGKFAYRQSDDLDISISMDRLSELLNQWEMETYDYEDRDDL